MRFLGRLDTRDDYTAFRRQTTTYLYRSTLGARCDLLDDDNCNSSTLGRDDQRPWQPDPHSSLAFWRHGRANDHVQTKMSSRLMHRVVSHQWHALFGLDGKAQYDRVDSSPRSIGSLLYSNSWNPVTDLSPEANLVVVVVVVDMWCLCADVRGDERFVQGNTGLFAKDLKQRPSLFSAGQCATP